jgi:hypothetical protein
MTNSLRDAFDDLVTVVPEHVVRDDLPAAAWAAGRRRRLRRRLVNGALAAAAVVVAAVVVVPMVQDVRSLPPASDERQPSVSSYPQRIGHQWWVRDLPDRPGPAAGLIQIYRGGDQVSEWHVISPTGHRWRLPMPNTDIYPTISPDGRYLGFLIDNAGPYVIHDLATGALVEFAEFSDGSLYDDVPVYDAPYSVYSQNPSFWSPTGRLAWIPGYAEADSDELRSEFVLGVHGSMTRIERRSSLGLAAGWTSEDALVFVKYHYANPERSEPPVQEISVSTSDLDGNVIRTVTLDPGRPWETDFGSQWDAVVSPDGTEIAVIEEISFDGYRLHRFDLSNGSPTGEPTDVANAEVPCASAGPTRTQRSQSGTTRIRTPRPPSPTARHCGLWLLSSKASIAAACSGRAMR